MHQEDWLEIRRHYDFLQKDQIKATVIRITLIFVVPLSYFLVPLDENRTQTHEFVSAVTGSHSLSTRSLMRPH